MFDFLPNYYTAYLEATVTTLKVSLIALLVGLILGIVICLAKISTFKVLNVIAAVYVEVIRNTLLCTTRNRYFIHTVYVSDNCSFY